MDIDNLIAIDTRYVGEAALARNDRDVVHLAFRYFNSYLRSALWVSGGYEGDRVTLLGLGRVQWESNGNDGLEPDLVDVGLRGILHRDSFAGSIEYVKRFALASALDDSYRLALVGEAKLGGSWFTLTIGKDYDSAQSGSFFALANVALTSGDPQVK